MSIPHASVPSPLDDRPSSLAAAQEEELFFEAVSVTRMPMIVTDPYRPDNPIIFANQAFLDLTGYRAAEVLGRNCRLLQGPGTDRETVGRIRAAVEERRVVGAELMNYRRDGSAFWNALFISPLVDRSGRLRYFFSSQLDVSRRHDAEEALQQAQKMEALGQFTGSIAHDFNNLLQVISGYLDSLRAGPAAADPEAKAALDTIAAAADRGATLTRQLLGFARKQRLEGRVVDLNTLIGTIQAMAAKALGEGIVIETRLDPGLWTARLDPVQAEMAILNLLMNARDAMPQGGRIEIVTENRSFSPSDADRSGDVLPGNYAVLTISDTGHGMPREVLARALDPFFTTKESGRGTGLGLSMAYGFMRQSNGGLAISSEEGHGTRVEMLFPAATGEPAARCAPAQAALSPGPLAGSESILVVEDQPDIAALAATILSEQGYRVRTAPNADAALGLLDGGVRVDLLFSDLIMPGAMNGVMLARIARRRFPGLRVLLATGFAAEVIERDGSLAGEFEIMGKPYRRAELLGRIREVLDAPAPELTPDTP